MTGEPEPLRNICQLCNTAGTGDTVTCELCTKIYHWSCLDPPLTSKPDHFSCPYHVTAENESVSERGAKRPRFCDQQTASLRWFRDENVPIQQSTLISMSSIFNQFVSWQELNQANSIMTQIRPSLSPQQRRAVLKSQKAHAAESLQETIPTAYSAMTIEQIVLSNERRAARKKAGLSKRRNAHPGLPPQKDTTESWPQFVLMDGTSLFLRKMPVILGRSDKNNQPDVDFGALARKTPGARPNLVSHHHATLTQTSLLGSDGSVSETAPPVTTVIKEGDPFVLAVHGRNGASLNGEKLRPGEAAVQMRSGDILNIGGVSVTFIVPSIIHQAPKLP
ncbi:hypothetical protein Pelo_14085 [Pelomyxa schiedti]|nr:hypothetical protein Pelo_14085 [Pelomyxa schiedti]